MYAVLLASNFYSALATAVLFLHGLFIVWVIFGALLVRSRPILRWLHIASLVSSCESYSDVGRVATELGFDYVLCAKSTSIKKAIGMCPPISKLIPSPYASGRTHRVESRIHSLSDVRTERNNAAEHPAEIAVASPKAAEIE
jgi:Protein of Unknown function (DUF2784)